MDPGHPHRSLSPSPARRRQGTAPINVTAAASGPPATETGTDPSAAAGHPTAASPEASREHTRRHPPAMDSGEDPLTPGSRRSQQRRTFKPRRLPLTRGEKGMAMSMWREWHAREAMSHDAADSSSSSQQRSICPAPISTGSGTTLRQSVLYSDRPRRAQGTRPPQHVEHPGEMSAPVFSASGSAGSHSVPGAERAVTRTRMRQSVLYSNRPRRPQPRHTQTPLPTDEHPREVTISEVDGSVTNEPTLEPLSLSDPSPLTPYIIEQTDDGDDRSLPGLALCGQTVLYFYPPIGITRSMLLDDSPTIIVSKDEEDQPKPDSDVEYESNESDSEMEESERPSATLRECLDSVFAIEYAERTARAAELGIEPPSAVIARAAAEAQRQEEKRSLQASQQDSAGAMQRHEASTEDIVRKGKKWMCEEVMLCFKKCIERRPDRVGLEYKLDDLCCQCFNVDRYNKVFHHYNFRVMMKMPSSVNWTVELYFAEVKQMFGRKYYFCCPLEQDEKGDCYACKNQGVDDLKHPATGGFDMGSPDDEYSLW